mmetsp:Transcript_11786/g.37517  ORF Transcript_11786/g.37517 Transcript_11786/m.37517 type:complete len:175 (+) Transcript_11786:27-551(+)
MLRRAAAAAARGLAAGRPCLSRRRLSTAADEADREAGIALWRKHRAAFKSPRRKASAILEAVKQEEMERFRRIEVPDFRAGDAIEVTMLWELGQEKTTKVRGMVLGRVNKGLNSSVLLYCVAMATPYLRRIPLYAPDITAIRIVQRAFLHKGKKRVRRAKLTYLVKKGYTIRAP